MSDDYRRLVEKVDSLADAIGERRRDDLACRAGCAGCCQVELSVAAVEARALLAHLRALSPPERRAIAARADREEGRCVMLDDDDRCSVHPARPLVCRTQGLPLLYPAGFVPADAVLLRTSRGEVTVCPLNFRDALPEGADLVDAERIDTLLALVDRLEAERGASPARVALRALARLQGQEPPSSAA